jgi:hypothetical protein
MSYRAMALVAASLLFATQCYAASTTYNNSRSNNFKQTKQPGGNSAAKPVNTSKSNTYRQGSTTSGGGAGKTAKKMKPIQPVHRNQQGTADNDRRSLAR